jgi:ion channel-forming bestrophin family protein
MYTARTIKLAIILKFAWQAIFFFFGYASVITGLYLFFDLRFLTVPFLPISLIGTAVAFYVGFKNNSSYARLWEARQVWGAIINISRTWGDCVSSYISNHNAPDTTRLKHYHQVLLYRHLAFVNALRIRLRSRTTWDTADDPGIAIVQQRTSYKQETLQAGMAPFLPPEEVDELMAYTNQATQILHLQSLTISTLRQEGLIDPYQHVELGRIIGQLTNQQGACERIKTFPFPRQYAYFSKVFVWLFILVLPFGLLTELSKLGENFVWLTIPFHMLVSWVFYTMEVVGDTSENPFENSINDIPMTAICRTIEIDLREMLQETNIPKPLTPTNNILM